MDFEFRPRPIPTIIAILAALAFLGLGVWQTVRFFERSGVEALQRERKNLPVVELHDVSALSDPDLDFRAAAATGTLRAEPTFMVAYRRHLGHQGCWIVNPLELPDGSVVLAVRGFVIESSHGRCEPPPLTEPARRTWRTLVHTPPPNPIDRAARDAEPSPATTWQSFDIEGMYEKLENPQRPARDTALLLDERYTDPPTIFSGDDVATPYLSSSQHLSYAATWFASVLIVAGIWGGVSIRRI